jgi:hypothetical protein
MHDYDWLANLAVNVFVYVASIVLIVSYVLWRLQQAMSPTVEEITSALDVMVAKLKDIDQNLDDIRMALEKPQPFP